MSDKESRQKVKRQVYNLEENLFNTDFFKAPTTRELIKNFKNEIMRGNKIVLAGIMLLMFNISATAQQITANGYDWTITKGVDEFGDATGDETLSFETTNGRFSNTATTGSKLSVVSIVYKVGSYNDYKPEFYFAFSEYGHIPASFSKQFYTMKLRDDKGETIKVKIFQSGRLIKIIKTKDNKKVLEMFKASKVVKFYFEPLRYDGTFGDSSYSFKINTASFIKNYDKLKVRQK